VEKVKEVEIGYSREEVKLMASGYGVLVAIRHLARHMATPAKTGFFISVPQILSIAERLGIAAMPRNDRQWFFEEVLKTAFDADKLREFLDELDALAAAHIEALKGLASQYPKAGELWKWSIESAEAFRSKVREVARLYERFVKLKEENREAR